MTLWKPREPEEYSTFEEISAIARLEDLHRLGYPGYFVNCLGDVFAFRYKTSGLNQQKVNEIREKRNRGNYTYAQLAKEYNVSSSQIWKISKNVIAKDYLKMTISPDERGYRQAAIWKNGSYFPKRVGVLVLEAFVGPCPPDHECCHGPGGNSDDRLENVYWGTHSQNMKDKVRDGTDHRGEKHGRAKLTNKTVLEIRTLYKGGMTLLKIAEKYDISFQCVSKVINRETWKHI